MRHQRNPRNQEKSEANGLDPIALTIALWLGLVVSVAAIGRMSQQAIAQANLDEARGVTQTVVRPFAPSFAPYGT